MSKPRVKIDLKGPNGNVFAVIGQCAAALREAGQKAEAEELKSLAFEERSYADVLKLCRKYVSLHEL